MEDHARYTRPNFSYYLGAAVAERLRALTNYDAVVTVVNPTREGQHYAHLRGESSGFSKMGHPGGSADGSQPSGPQTNQTSEAAGSRR